jgi:hypothetical protein
MPLSNPPVIIQDVGVTQGAVNTINIIGSAITTVSGNVATINVTGIAVPNIVYDSTIFIVPNNTQVSYASPIIINTGGTILIVGTGTLIGIIT